MTPASATPTHRRRPQKLTALLGLTLDGSRLEGVVLRRTNGSLALVRRFTANLTLDPLTAAPELVGREIRNHLDAAEIKERHCLLGLPLKWVLTAHTELPPLAPADAASLLQVEAERAFHHDPATLQLADSRAVLPGDRRLVLQTGIPTSQLVVLENVLAAAKLKPVSFSLGLCALQPPSDEGAAALFIGETQVSLQFTGAGGVLALRALEGTVETTGSQTVVQAATVAREIRVTYGQLPPELRSSIRRLNIYGPAATARRLADELELRLEPLGLRVEIVNAYAPGELGLTLPTDAAVSGAFSLAARYLAGQTPVFEFLPPKPTLLEIFAAKYASGRLRSAGLAGAAVVLLGLGFFLYQQIQLWSLRSQWNKIAPEVQQLQGISANIDSFRSWYGSRSWNISGHPNLLVLRQLSLAFPEDGAVTAKSIEIRDGNTVTCSGTAADQSSLLAMEKRLADTAGIQFLHHEQSRGKSPLQFTLSFHFNPGAVQ